MRTCVIIEQFNQEETEARMPAFKRYNQAAHALYGDAIPPVPRKKSSDGEAKEQMKFFAWLDKENILAFHPANGGRRDKREAYMLKLSGVKAGVPDVFVMVPNNYYAGLVIELKRKDGGVVSTAQEYWIDRLRENGYCVEVCHGYEEAKLVTLNYLSNGEIK